MIREALVVGINRYPFLKNQEGRPQHLEKPAQDAEAIAKLLETFGQFNVQRFPAIQGGKKIDGNPQNVNLPTLTELENKISLLFNPPSGPPDTALLFFAGHGLRHEVGGVSDVFLATSDVQPHKGMRGLSLHWLGQLLQKSPVKQQIIILDCCHSGEIFKYLEIERNSEDRKRDRCVIVASRDFEVAYEEISGDHGLLTGALLAGFNPANYEDGWVTNYALKDFVQKQLTNIPQRPIFRNWGDEILLAGQPAKMSRALLSQEVCPYKGLCSFEFDNEDPQYFYGRTNLTDLLIDKVQRGNFLAVLGASGSGKSSVIKAGLLYQLKEGKRLSGSESWLLKIFRPGEHPFENLVRGFWGQEVSEAVETKAEELQKGGGEKLVELVKKMAGEKRVILVADQFEECFTLCQGTPGKDKQRQDFFECLMTALELGKNQLCLVITMRDDFFGKCAEYGKLAALIDENFVRIKPMEPAQLKEAITKPAEKVGLEIQRELVEQMLQDVEGPGSLPLLQYTLTELWRNRQANRLTLTDYRKLGGVKETLQKRAEEVYLSLNLAEKEIAKRIFVELTQLGEGTEDTRKQILKSEILGDPQSEALVQQVLQKLEKERLVVTSQLQVRGENSQAVTVVDVAHEALIRHWKRLQNWVNENREAIRLERKIEEAAKEWESRGKSKDVLLRGLKLAEAENYIKNYSSLGLLSSLAKEFVQKSRRAQNNLFLLRFGGGSFAVILLITVFSILFFVVKNSRKNMGILVERVQYTQLSENTKKVEKMLEFEPVNALVLAIETVGKNLSFPKKEIRPDVQSSLIKAVQISQERNLLKGHESKVMSVAFSRDGKIVSGDSDGGVRIWDKTGKSIIIPKAHQGIVWSIAFSPDGKTIASGGADGSLRIWETTGKVINNIPQAHLGAIHAVAFSKNGNNIVSAGGDGKVRLRDSQGKLIKVIINGENNTFLSVAYSLDGNTIVAGDKNGKMWFWDSKKQRLTKNVQAHEGFVWSLAFSPDNEKIVSAGEDGKVKLWDRKGNSIGQPFTGHKGDVISVAFSPKGDKIVSGGKDGKLWLWETEGKPIGLPFIGHEGVVWSVAFSGDGNSIVSGGGDNMVRLWDGTNKFIGQTFKAHTSKINAVAISPDSKNFVSGDINGDVFLWDTNGGSFQLRTHRYFDEVMSLGISKNGTILSGDVKGTVQLWDAKGTPINTFFLTSTQEKEAYSYAITPDGKTIVSGHKDGKIKLWDSTGKLISDKWFVGHSSYIYALSISQDGKMVVSAGADKTVRFWNINGKPIGSPFSKHRDSVFSVAISADEKTIVSAGADRNVRLSDKRGKSLGKPFKGHQGAIQSVAMTADGKFIVSAGEDAMVRLWDREGNLLGEFFQGTNNPVYSVAISSDGGTIIGGNDDGSLRVWQNAKWKTWLEMGCKHLRKHSIFTNPETLDLEKEELESAKKAKETCRKYVWLNPNK